MALVRVCLTEELGIWRAADLEHVRTGTYLRIGGLVICHQRLGTPKASSSSGTANAIATPQVFAHSRLRISVEPFLLIEGGGQKIDGGIHVKSQRIARLTYGELAVPTSHDFH